MARDKGVTYQPSHFVKLPFIALVQKTAPETPVQIWADTGHKNLMVQNTIRSPEAIVASGKKHIAIEGISSNPALYRLYNIFHTDKIDVSELSRRISAITQRQWHWQDEAEAHRQILDVFVAMSAHGMSLLPIDRGDEFTGLARLELPIDQGASEYKAYYAERVRMHYQRALGHDEEATRMRLALEQALNRKHGDHAAVFIARYEEWVNKRYEQLDTYLQQMGGGFFSMPTQVEIDYPQFAVLMRRNRELMMGKAGAVPFTPEESAFLNGLFPRWRQEIDAQDIRAFSSIPEQVVREGLLAVWGSGHTNMEDDINEAIDRRYGAGTTAVLAVYGSVKESLEGTDGRLRQELPAHAYFVNEGMGVSFVRNTPECMHGVLPGETILSCTGSGLPASLGLSDTGRAPRGR